ncbi:unnamed protein product, partial [Cuscuta europaea]
MAATGSSGNSRRTTI